MVLFGVRTASMMQCQLLSKDSPLAVLNLPEVAKFRQHLICIIGNLRLVAMDAVEEE